MPWGEIKYFTYTILKINIDKIGFINLKVGVKNSLKFD
jgi:hypothetical protein